MGDTAPLHGTPGESGAGSIIVDDECLVMYREYVVRTTPGRACAVLSGDVHMICFFLQKKVCFGGHAYYVRIRVSYHVRSILFFAEN